MITKENFNQTFKKYVQQAINYLIVFQLILFAGYFLLDGIEPFDFADIIVMCVSIGLGFSLAIHVFKNVALEVLSQNNESRNEDS